MAKNFFKKLQSLNKQRCLWAKLSTIIIITFLTIIIKWNYFVDNNLLLPTFSFLGTVTIIWWFWTMYFIKNIIHYKQQELQTINEIMDSLKDIRQSISNNK